MQAKIEGIIAAMVTPLYENGHINIGETRRLITFLLNKGVNGLFILGTTGEGLILSVEERKKFVEVVIDNVDQKIPIIVHASHIEQNRLKELIEHAQNIGASAISILPPLFYALDEDGIKNYFKTILEDFADCPFLLYNIPQFVGNKITPSILQDLSKTCPNLIGIKDSSSDLIEFQKFLVFKKNLTILMGHDNLDYPALLMGAQGVVSGPSSVFPEIYTHLYEAIKKGDFDIALKYQLIINEITNLFSGKNKRKSNLVFFKKALQVRGFNVGGIQSPFYGVSLPENTRFVNRVKDFLENKYFQEIEDSVYL